MLHQIESKILSVLSGRQSAEEVAAAASLPLSSVLSFSQSLREKGYVSLEVAEEPSLTLTSDAIRFAKEGLPEQKVLASAHSGISVASLSQEERTIGLAWATKNGWVKIEGGNLRIASEPSGAYALQSSLQSIAQGGAADEATTQLLLKRKLATQSISKKIYLSPTAVQPKEAASDTSAENAVTRKMLLDGSWRGKLFRKYDVSAPVELPSPARRHMISRLRARISRIFSEMGFEEMQGDESQPSFWNFDALFQPQDHPARELADTFYLKGSAPLPNDAALVSRVKKTQEKYWCGTWTEANASKPVLRTHTTAVSARYLYERCSGNSEPKKYFSVGKVYRNEATDYKHLAEFFQVEGIVVWDGATFRDLLGCLKEFYKRLGFEKIRFQPSYFPYTEPSLEISVYFEKKSQWLELGGAGIFRPEVSIPLCDRYPVLAWGLSLERPLMLLNDMDDIRDFYRSNAGWLRRQKID